MTFTAIDTEYDIDSFFFINDSTNFIASIINTTIVNAVIIIVHLVNNNCNTIIRIENVYYFIETLPASYPKSAKSMK